MRKKTLSLEEKIILSNYKKLIDNNNIPSKVDKPLIATDEEIDYIKNASKGDKDREQDFLNILKIIKKIKFLTPDMLTSFYFQNKTREENSFNLLELASIFGGPLEKTTYCLVNQKYVYTDKNLFIDKRNLNYFNKVSYILCKLNDFEENIKIVDIESILKYKNGNIYCLMRVTIARDNDFEILNIVFGKEEFNFYKKEYPGLFINIQRIGELLNNPYAIISKLFGIEIEKDLSEEAFFTYEIETLENNEKEV